ncbi:MAG: efflux RND transporter periplasmic adaptor subunit [Steroidobacteraceae bacterium]
MNSHARQPSKMLDLKGEAGTERITSLSDRGQGFAAHSTGAADAIGVVAPDTVSGSARWPVKSALFLLLAIVAGVGAWYAMHRPAPKIAAVSPDAVPLQLATVDLATVEPRVLTRMLPLSGSMAPVTQATVKAKVDGEILQLSVREGQDVREGDVIARIDTRHLQAQYDRELAAVDKARADLNLAMLNRDKNRALLEQKYISQNTFESTESAYAGSVASLKLAEAQARVAKVGLDDAVVRAPFSGTVATRLVQAGEKVSADTSIVTLVDLRQLLLEAAVPAAEIPAVGIGQQVRFKVGGFGQRQFEGEVQRISPMTVNGSRAITIYIAVPNADRALKGGMFAQGELVLNSSEPVLAVPVGAVKFESAVPIVYLLEGDTIARRQVTLGTQTEGSEFVEIRTGVQAGDRVIVPDIGERKPGSKASVRDSAKKTA